MAGSGQNSPKGAVGRWSEEEHRLFMLGLETYGREWKKIADTIPTRTVVQIRTHAQKHFQKLAKKQALAEAQAAAAAEVPRTKAVVNASGASSGAVGAVGATGSAAAAAAAASSAAAAAAGGASAGAPTGLSPSSSRKSNRRVAEGQAGRKGRGKHRSGAASAAAAAKPQRLLDMVLSPVSPARSVSGSPSASPSATTARVKSRPGSASSPKTPLNRRLSGSTHSLQKRKSPVMKPTMSSQLPMSPVLHAVQHVPQSPGQVERVRVALSSVGLGHPSPVAGMPNDPPSVAVPPPPAALLDAHVGDELPLPLSFLQATAMPLAPAFGLPSEATISKRRRTSEVSSLLDAASEEDEVIAAEFAAGNASAGVPSPVAAYSAPGSADEDLGWAGQAHAHPRQQMMASPLRGAVRGGFRFGNSSAGSAGTPSFEPRGVVLPPHFTARCVIPASASGASSMTSGASFSSISLDGAPPAASKVPGSPVAGQSQFDSFAVTDALASLPFDDVTLDAMAAAAAAVAAAVGSSALSLPTAKAEPEAFDPDNFLCV